MHVLAIEYNNCLQEVICISVQEPLGFSDGFSGEKLFSLGSPEEQPETTTTPADVCLKMYVKCQVVV